MKASMTIASMPPGAKAIIVCPSGMDRRCEASMAVAPATASAKTNAPNARCSLEKLAFADRAALKKEASMRTTQILALLNSHIDGDEDQFL